MYLLEREALRADGNFDRRSVCRALDLVADVLLHLLDDVAREGAADQALGAVHCLGGIELPLAFGFVANELVALVVDREDRRHSVVAALVGNDFDRAFVGSICSARVRGAEIDANDACHDV